MTTELLRVILEMVTSNYKKGAQDAARATDGITKSGDNASKSVGGLSGRLDGFRKTAAAAAGAAGAAALVYTLQDSVRAASDLGESVNAVEKTFGSASDQVLAFSDVASSAAGLSKTAFNELATATGSLLTNFGFSAQEAATQATQLTVRAADLASVFNTDVDQALNAVNAALRGETEPIRKFGVSLNDAAIRAKAVELGLADTTAEVDANGKAVAALELIYEQTANAQGDFIQTNDSLANSARIAAAEWENAKAEFGQAALPVASSLLSRFNEGLTIIRSNFDDAANQSLQFGRAMDAIAEKMQEGENASGALIDGLFFIAENAELSGDQLLALASAAGVSVDAIDASRESIVEQARAMGFSEEVIDEFVGALDSAIAPAEGAADAVGDLGDEAGNAAKETDKLKDSTVNLATELRKQADPIFRAVSAFQDYQSTLQEIDEDGERTGEELLDLADAVLTSEEALSELGGGNLERGIQVIADAIDLTTQEVRDLLRELGILDGTNFTVTGTVIRATSTAAESGDLDPSIAAAVRRAGGRAYGGPTAAGRSYIVGERGPEFFTPTMSGRISSGPLSSGSVVFNNTFNVSEATSAKSVVREIREQLSRMDRELA